MDSSRTDRNGDGVCGIIYPIKQEFMKMNRKDWMGMVVYFLISLIFGGGFGLLTLIVHEDNDRCHYYHGEWNKGDLTRGCIAVVVGMVVRYFLNINFLN